MTLRRRNMFTTIKEEADVPIFQKCCFFIPIRKGLIIWGYINMIVTLALMIYGVKELAEYRYSSYLRSYIAMFIVYIIVQFADMAFSILLVMAGHKKNMKQLQTYYYFALGKLLLCTISLTVIFLLSLFINTLWYYYSMNELWYYLVIENPAVELIYIIIQLYFVLLVRSELLRMRDIQQKQKIPTLYQNNLCFEANKECLIPVYK